MNRNDEGLVKEALETFGKAIWWVILHQALLLDLYIQTNQAVELRSAPYPRQMKSPK